MIVDHGSIKREYDRIRAENDEVTAKRQKEVYERIPRIKALQKEMTQKGQNLTAKALTGETVLEKEIKVFQEEMKTMLQEKLVLLTEHSYPTNYLDPIYTCDICKDKGVVGETKKWCRCYRRKITKQLMCRSNMEAVLKRENFDTFDLNVFSTDVDDDYDISPKDYMEKLFQKAHSYVGQFKNEKKNLLFVGPTGTGKTFLTHCIAEDLIRRGYMVVYFTAMEMLENMKASAFDNDSHAKQMISFLKHADLLILDDLGTEMPTDYAISELFSIINSRMIQKDKATIISTNLTPQQIQDRYSERLSSRLIGNGDIWEFFGQDIRISLKIKSYGKK